MVSNWVVFTTNETDEIARSVTSKNYLICKDISHHLMTMTSPHDNDLPQFIFQSREVKDTAYLKPIKITKIENKKFVNLGTFTSLNFWFFYKEFQDLLWL